MIIDRKPLSMTEANEFIEKDANDEVKAFVKKFVKLTPAKAKELRKKLEGLDLIKVKQEHIAKVIDILPENAEEINKIFSDVALDENETSKLLETIKEFV